MSNTQEAAPMNTQDYQMNGEFIPFGADLLEQIDPNAVHEIGATACLYGLESKNDDVFTGLPADDTLLVGAGTRFDVETHIANLN